MVGTCKVPLSEGLVEAIPKLYHLTLSVGEPYPRRHHVKPKSKQQHVVRG
jgi:hypothetical protein